VSTEGGTALHWSPNGREILYRNGSTIMSVPVTATDRLSTGMPRARAESRWLSTFADTYGVMPDGNRVVVVEREVPEMPQQVNLVMNWFADLRQRASLGR
jgi:hypothetical protein